MTNTQTTLNIINATAIKLNGQDVDLQQQKASYAYGTIRLRDSEWTIIRYKTNEEISIISNVESLLRATFDVSNVLKCNFIEPIVMVDPFSPTM